MSLAILMSTFNGEKYLKEQIDSLLNQEYEAFDIYIRDDGSTDQTVSILENYEHIYPNIYLLKDTQGNIGVFKSFMYLLSQVHADYYMFCDQDDVWLSNKISMSMKRMNELEDIYTLQIPLLVFTDLVLVNHKLDVIAESVWKITKTVPDIALKYLNGVCPMAGCTMLFNDAAKKVSLPISDKGWVHDYWVALSVAKNGIIGYVSQPLIWYRQHGMNEIGAIGYPKNMLWEKVKNIRKTLRINWCSYKMVHFINNIGWFDYLIVKIKYAIILRKIS